MKKMFNNSLIITRFFALTSIEFKSNSKFVFATIDINCDFQIKLKIFTF